ncbi:Alpha/Beta hydrolase protein [Pavlovales sp. CCMP2436]|nr:Alpha/Beta hydrolase protein [Pavlovales sp. CCMP2436]
MKRPLLLLVGAACAPLLAEVVAVQPAGADPAGWRAGPAPTSLNFARPGTGAGRARPGLLERGTWWLGLGDGGLPQGARLDAGSEIGHSDERDSVRTRQRRKWGTRVGGLMVLGGGSAAVLQRVAARPVVLVHGVLQTSEFMREVADWIEREIPGTYVKPVEIGNGALDSLTRSMNWQCNELARTLQADPRLKKGFNLIGYSQGALLSRAFIERHNTPRVFNFISWLGPQGGQFGVPDYEPLLRHINWVTSPMWYTDMLQERLSFANYWRDPYRLDAYKKTPQKECFASFAENSTTNLSCRQAPDWIGLKTLAESKRLHFGVTNCKHDEATTSACKFQLFDKLSLVTLPPPLSLSHCLFPPSPPCWSYVSLGQMRTAEVALKKQNEELKSQRELRREALGEKGAPASPAETGAMPATRRGRAEKSMVDLKPAVVAEQVCYRPSQRSRLRHAAGNRRCSAQTSITFRTV